MIEEFQTSNAFIASVCDQAGEVVQYIPPKWTGKIKDPATFDAIDDDEKKRGPISE